MQPCMPAVSARSCMVSMNNYTLSATWSTSGALLNAMSCLQNTTKQCRPAATRKCQACKSGQQRRGTAKLATKQRARQQESMLRQARQQSYSKQDSMTQRRCSSCSWHRGINAAPQRYCDRVHVENPIRITDAAQTGCALAQQLKTMHTCTSVVGISTCHP
jgi:hypothetical protein